MGDVQTTTTDATSADTTTTADTGAAADTQTSTDQLGDEGKKALDNERRARRDAEKEAKAAKAELEKLREATMNENEKAISAAKAEGRTEALREAGTRVVEAEVRAAAKGRVPDVDALLEVLDATKFLTDDGEPDRDAISAWVDRFAPAGDQRTGDGFPDLGQGTRSTEPALGSDPLTQTLKNKLGIR